MAMNVVYITGSNRQNILDIENAAKTIGWIVLSPVILPEGLAESCYLPIRLAMVEASDYIYVCPGGFSDAMTRAEITYATTQKMAMLTNIEQLKYVYKGE